jgi:hypothetical protein
MPQHTHSIDRWDDATGSNLYEHLAGVNDFLFARACFAAAVEQWPQRNEGRIIERMTEAPASSGGRASAGAVQVS